jgi:hypothetical protein
MIVLRNPWLNNFVQATPVYAFLLFQRHVPGAPDENRSAQMGWILSKKQVYFTVNYVREGNF